jgi:hypothetical protein
MYCCILLDFLCELYSDARIHKHQAIRYLQDEETLITTAVLFHVRISGKADKICWFQNVDSQWVYVTYVRGRHRLGSVIIIYLHALRD